MESLAHAKAYAEEWYLGLLGKLHTGEIKGGTTFAAAAKQFLREFPVITQGQRNKQYVQGHERRLRLFLLPFFGAMVLSDITPGTVQEYRIARTQQVRKHRVAPGTGIDGSDIAFKPPARNTLHQEIVVIRQVLQTAHRHGWVSAVPDLTPPYKSSGKITHRAWFSPTEYRQLYEATRERRRTRIERTGNGMPNSCTTMCCSWPIRV